VSVRAGAIRAMSSVLYHAGVTRPLTAAAARFGPPAAFPVLTFHRVNDDGDPFLPALSTRVFAARVAHLAAHFRVCPVEELADGLAAGRVPRNALAITFDDGYRDNLVHAAPVLERHRLPATIFLATGFVGTGQAPWYDRLALALKGTTRPRLAVGDRLWGLGSTSERLGALDALLEWFKRVPDETRRAEVERLVDELSGGRLRTPPRLMLDWDDVRQLRAMGFSIGAHTVTHPILARCTPDRVWEEIAGSKRAIETALGEPVRAFAYPNGGADDYSETITNLVREAGYTCAVTTRRGLNTADTPLYELRRGGPWEEHLPTYALKLCYYRLAGA